MTSRHIYGIELPVIVDAAVLSDSFASSAFSMAGFNQLTLAFQYKHQDSALTMQFTIGSYRLKDTTNKYLETEETVSGSTLTVAPLTGRIYATTISTLTDNTTYYWKRHIPLGALGGAQASNFILTFTCTGTYTDTLLTVVPIVSAQ